MPKFYEPPWRLMSGLNLRDGNSLRRVMEAIHYRSSCPGTHNPAHHIETVLHDHERASVSKIMREAQNNKLLTDMMLRFASKYNIKGQKKVTDAASEFSAMADYFVRNPGIYREEYREAEEEFYAMVDKEMGVWDRRGNKKWSSSAGVEESEKNEYVIESNGKGKWKGRTDEVLGDIDEEVDEEEDIDEGEGEEEEESIENEDEDDLDYKQK